MTSKKDSFIGRRLHKRYIIMDLIAKGGMGRVYLARDQQYRDKVAIKYIPFSRVAPSDRPLFEARVLTKLSHPNLPKVREVFRDERAHYLVMEYISGETLHDLVKRRGSLSPERAARYVMSILKVLNYLHGQERPIIHRDIKPSNLKFNANGRLMLVDFGIAKELQPAKRTRLEARGALTRGYGPPEQYKGGTDGRTDIFAVGGVLYYLLTGKHPPDVQSHPETRHHHVDPRDENPKVPHALAEIVVRATNMNKEYRYSNTEDMLYALKQALFLSTAPQKTVGEVLEGVAPHLQHSTSSSNKNSTLMTMVFILLLLLALIVIGYMLFGPQI